MAGPIGGLKVDRNPPTIAVHRTPAPNANGWNNTDVVAQFVASDAGSGVVAPAAVDVVFTLEGANQGTTVTVSDLAGNATTASIAGINIDKTPPKILFYDSLTPGSHVFGRTSTLRVRPSDTSTVTRVDFLVNDSVIGSDAESDDNGDYYIVWDSTSVPDQTQLGIRVVAYDAADNSANETSFVNVINRGLVAAFGFEEPDGDTARDAATHVIGDIANDGVFGAGVSRVPGPLGQALAFDGLQGMITVPDATSLDLARMTLTAWLRPTALSQWRSVIVKERAQTGLVYGLYAHSDRNGPSTYIRSGDYDHHATTPAPLEVDTWHHLAATYDGILLKLYVDGLLTASFPESGRIVASGRAMFIGGNLFWGEHFAGVLDDIKVFNRALSTTEIEALAVMPK
jgi:hypothetical protein